MYFNSGGQYNNQGYNTNPSGGNGNMNLKPGTIFFVVVILLAIGYKTGAVSTDLIAKIAGFAILIFLLFSTFSSRGKGKGGGTGGPTGGGYNNTYRGY